MQKYSLNEVIEMAVQIERSGYTYYNHALERKDLSAESRKLLEKLRDQESHHEKTFLALRGDADEMALDEAVDWDTVSAYMQAITDSRIFYTEDAAIKAAGEARDEREIVMHAINFEKDTLLYFHALLGSVGDDRTRSAVRHIIDEEVAHVLQLNNYKAGLK